MPLTLNLFGGFDARLADGSDVVFRRKKAQALLAYVALNPDQAHPRSKLAALLWGDAPAAAARANVRQVLAAIRQSLPPDCLPLMIASDAVRLDPARISVDVARFERLAAEDTPEALAEAVAIYRGALLEGLDAQPAAFEEWLLGERERLRERAIEIVARLLAEHTRRGEIDQAIQAAVQLLTLDPLQEPAHCALMRLYARQGRRGAALRQYQTCVDVIHRELGAEPDAETKRAYQEVVSTPEQMRQPAPSAGAGLRQPGSLPLVGRQAERRRLVEAVARARTRRGQAIVILGEAGVGKSRLVAELDELASREGFALLVGRAYETEQILPFGVWVQAFRSGGVLERGGAAGRLNPVWRAELGRLFPELSAAVIERPPSAEEHLRLFEAIARLIACVAGPAPLAVVLDDTQWADAMSVRLLPFVTRRIRDLPVLLIVTAREESVGDASGLSTAFDEIAREPHATVCTLPALSKDDTYSLISAAGQRTPRARVAADHIWAVSEGNPFVALEMVRAGEEDAAAAPHDRTPLPQRIRQVIRGRLDRLEPRARQLADAAAVIGRDFDFTLLREAVGLDEGDAAAGLEELVRRRVVRLSGDEFAFAHDRIRHVVYDDLLPPRRAALHHGVANAIERLYHARLDEVYDRLGYHYARTDQDERAVTYLARFAEQAGRRYALAEAVEALADARARVEKLSAPARERRLLELLVTEASYLVFLGRFGTLVDLLTRHRALVQHVDDPALEGPYYFWLALTLSMAGQHAEATADAERALAAARRAHDRMTQGRACAVLALVSFWSGAPLNGAEHARHAVEHLSVTTDQEWLFFAQFYLAANSIQLGDFETAVEATRRALTIAKAVDSARLETFVSWGSGWLETVRGNPAAGVEQCGRAARMAPDPLGLANALGFLGHAHLEHGEPRAAIPPLEEAIGRSAAFGFRAQQGLFSAWLAEAQLEIGNAQQARELAAAALQLTREVSFPYGIGMSLRAAGRVALASGNHAGGHAALKDALQTFAAIPARHEVRRTEHLLAAGRRS